MVVMTMFLEGLVKKMVTSTMCFNTAENDYQRNTIFLTNEITKSSHFEGGGSKTHFFYNFQGYNIVEKLYFYGRRQN